jgi:hypothetical protein
MARLASPTKPFGLGPPSPAVRERALTAFSSKLLSRTAGERAERSEAGEGYYEPAGLTTIFPVIYGWIEQK